MAVAQKLLVLLRREKRFVSSGTGKRGGGSSPKKTPHHHSGQKKKKKSFLEGAEEKKRGKKKEVSFVNKHYQKKAEERLLLWKNILHKPFPKRQKRITSLRIGKEREPSILFGKNAKVLQTEAEREKKKQSMSGTIIFFQKREKSLSI